MSKFKMSIREIGSVSIFDLEGSPTPDALQEAAWRIQKSIRRHRLQRIILNLQYLEEIDALSIRKLVAACIRPQQSLLFKVNDRVAGFVDETYLPRNMKVRNNEKEVAEDFGPFLLEKEQIPAPDRSDLESYKNSPGYDLEKRRSKRMHVALPLELKLTNPQTQQGYTVRGIATNISEGGLFVEFLDLSIAQQLETFSWLINSTAEILIFPSANFPEEYRISGKVLRQDLRKRQLGLALEFSI